MQSSILRPPAVPQQLQGCRPCQHSRAAFSVHCATGEGRAPHSVHRWRISSVVICLECNEQIHDDGNKGMACACAAGDGCGRREALSQSCKALTATLLSSSVLVDAAQALPGFKKVHIHTNLLHRN